MILDTNGYISCTILIVTIIVIICTVCVARKTTIKSFRYHTYILGCWFCFNLVFALYICSTALHILLDLLQVCRAYLDSHFQPVGGGLDRWTSVSPPVVL